MVFTMCFGDILITRMKGKEMISMTDKKLMH